MHARSDGPQVHVASMLPWTGASVVLLVLGFWAVLVVARSVPDLLRHLAQPCASCGLAAFEPPLKPYIGRSGPGERPSAADGAALMTFAPQARLGASARLLAPEGIGQGGIGGFAPEEVPLTLPGLGSGPGSTLTIDPAAPGGTGYWRRAMIGLSPAAIGDLTVTSAGALAGTFAASVPSGIGAAAQVWNLETRDDHGDRAAAGGPAPWLAGVWTAGAQPGGQSAATRDLAMRFSPYGLTERETFLDPNAAGWGSPGDALVGDAPAGDVAAFGTLSGGGTQRTEIRSAGFLGALFAQATVEHESPQIAANPDLLAVDGLTALDTFRAQASYRFAAPVTPSIGYFRSAGSPNAMRFVWTSGHQNTAGVVAGVTVVPWGAPAAAIEFLNLRLAARYVAYTEYNGIPRNGMAGTNALSLSLWGALRF